MSFVFYDTETTGVNTAFDQILQFGAIRTDIDLNEIDRFEIRCRLQERVIAHPMALLVTGVTLAQLTDTTLPCHYEMIRSIQRKLREWSPSVFIGYNSLRFDEHLLRSSLWKTLHPPYLTNTDGNSRTDAMRMVQAVSILRPNLFTVPLGANGRPSFKLDAIAPANGFDHSGAHDAVGDVKATIHLCRMIAENAAELWSDFMRFAQKAAVVDFVESEPAFGLVEFWSNRPTSSIVTLIGRNSSIPTELYALDLCVDPAELSALADAALSARLAKSPKPIHRIKSNGAPILTSLDTAPSAARGRSLSDDELIRRAGLVKSSSALGKRIIALLESTAEPKTPSVHVEEQIYDGFASNDDMALAGSFHQTTWTARPPIVGKIVDARLKTLARRLLYDENPELLSEHERGIERSLIAERLLAKAPDLPWCTLPQAIASCQELLGQYSGVNADRLKEYLAFCEDKQVALKRIP